MNYKIDFHDGFKNNIKNDLIKLNLFAFTLAEVLITLGIIGIIAAMVVPTLINNVQTAQYQNAWKKAYSNFNQAFNLIKNENGGTIKGAFTTANDFRDLFSEKMAYIKKCDSTESQGGCWNMRGGYRLDTGAQYGTDAWWFNSSYNPSIVLKDGSAIFFDVYTPAYTCNNSGGYPYCARVYLDTNGLKPPNTFGKDIFKIYVWENHLTLDGNGSVCDGQGENCSSYYLIN